jgi:hypothetical protein
MNVKSLVSQLRGRLLAPVCVACSQVDAIPGTAEGSSGREADPLVGA